MTRAMYRATAWRALCSSNAPAQEIIVVLPDRIVATDGCYGCGLVHRLERMTISWLSSSVAAATAELLMLDQTTVAHEVASVVETARIDHHSNNLYGAYGPDT